MSASSSNSDNSMLSYSRNAAQRYQEYSNSPNNQENTVPLVENNHIFDDYQIIGTATVALFALWLLWYNVDHSS